MKRYFYTLGVVHFGTHDVEHVTDTVDRDDEYVEIDRRTETVDLTLEGYCVFDRLRGHVDDAALAVCEDRDDAQKIVDALNAQEVPA